MQSKGEKAGEVKDCKQTTTKKVPQKQLYEILIAPIEDILMKVKGLTLTCYYIAKLITAQGYLC
jgi:hypothetical protein